MPPSTPPRRRRLVVVGASGHGKVVADAAAGSAEIVGFVDQRATPGDALAGLPVLGTENDLPALVAEYGIGAVVVAIGDNQRRAQVVERITALCPNLEFATVVHPTAALAADVRVGPGSVVLAGAILNPSAVVGRHCIVNTGASLDHDSRLHDFASLAPGVTTGGNVEIGAFTAVGLGASVIHRVSIGQHAVVGAGATVLRDLPDHVVAYGSPARVVRAREAGESYL